MGTRFQSTACPLCHDEFEDPVEYREHLAFMHDLVDDEGAETTLQEAPSPETQPAPPAPPGVAPLERSAPVPFVAEAASRPDLTAPVAVRVDRRVLPGLVVAVALQLVIALLGLAVVDGGPPAELTAASGSEKARTADNGDATPGESGSGASAGESATAAPPTTAAPAVTTGGDQARADAFAVRADDLPSGWQSFDPNAVGGDEGSGDIGPECTATNDPSETDALTAESYAGFVHEISVVVGGSMVLATEKDAIRTMDVIRELTPCFGEQMLAGMKSELPEGVVVTHGAFSSLGYPAYGDETAASSMPVTISGPGGQVPLRVDVLAIRRDRAIAMLMVINAANDLTPQQERGMLSAIDARMAPRAV